MGFCRRELLIFVLEGRELGQIQNCWEGMWVIFLDFTSKNWGFWGFSPRPPPQSPRVRGGYSRIFTISWIALDHLWGAAARGSGMPAGIRLAIWSKIQNHITNIGVQSAMLAPATIWKHCSKLRRKTYDLSKLWRGIKVSSESKSYLSYLQQPQIVTGQLYIYISIFYCWWVGRFIPCIRLNHET
jgi:hypothetical protein